MTDTTSLTKLRFPAQVTGYGIPPVAPPRFPKICTTIATYPNAAAVVFSSIRETPSGRAEAGTEKGGAGSLGPTGIGSGTSRMEYKSDDACRGKIGNSESRVWT